jgi:hypothetical protein
MATIGLGFTLSANAAKMGSGVNEAAKSLDKIGKAAKQTASDVSTLKTVAVGKMLASGLSAVARSFSNAARSALSYAKGVANAIDATNDLANRIGISVESLQSLQMAAKLSGVDDITGALQKMTIAIGNAGQSGNTEAFTRLGIDFAELQRLSPEEQFKQIQAAIAALPTEAERAAAAVAIFGRSGVELLPLMNQNLQEVEERLRKLGAIVGEDQVSAIGDMNDAFDLVAATVSGIFGQVVGNLAPAVTAMAKELLSFVESFSSVNGEGGSGIADTISSALLDIAEYLAGVFDNALAQFDQFSVSLADVGAVFTTVGNIFVAVSETLRAAFNIFEVAGNLLAVGIGKLLEGLGSWVSSDLEQFGRDMAQNASNAVRQNSAEGNAALQNAGAAASNAVFGTNQNTGATNGPASRAVARARLSMTPEERERRRQEREAEKAAKEGREAAAKANKDAEDAKARDEKALQDGLKKKNEKLAAQRQKVDDAMQFKFDNMRVLSKQSQEALQGNDVRSSEGMAQFMALLTGREDPAIAENRKANQKLAEVVRELRALQQAPVDILGAAA